MSNFTTWRSLVDGEEIVGIPDSVVAQYDATEEDSTGSISSIDDLIGSFDLSGTVEVISNGINGLKTYRFDGVDDLMQQDSTMASEEPFAIIAVVEQQEDFDSNKDIWDGVPDENFQLQDNGIGNTYNIRRDGSGYDENIEAEDDPSEPQILETHGIEGGGMELYQNGIFLGEDGSGDSDLDGLTLAADGAGDGNIEMDFGEVVVLEGFSDSDIQSERERLSDKWGTPDPT